MGNIIKQAWELRFSVRFHVDADLGFVAVFELKGFFHIGGYVMGLDYGNRRVDCDMRVDDE